MPRKEPDKSKRGLVIALIGVIVLALIGGGIYYWQGSGKVERAGAPDRQVQTPGEKPFEERGKVPERPKDKKVLDYGQLEKDPELQALIQERKEEYGIDDAVDMIVKPDESVRLGDTTVPMREILDKIRIKQGEVEEEDLEKKPEKKSPQELEKVLEEKARQVRERMVELEKALQSPEVEEQPRSQMAREMEELGKILSAHDKYRKIIDRIDKIQEKLPQGTEEQKKGARETIEQLVQARDKLGEALEERLVKRKAPDAYGIYVVRRGDNLWNIHFKFLKQYFENRGVELSPVADEPNKKGYSSGIGKILKFSENMVYIYNVREHRLDVNLDLIHPESKIVVFHMEKIFSLLDQIDYSKVKNIQFDGENIWIPAEN